MRTQNACVVLSGRQRLSQLFLPEDTTINRLTSRR